MEEVNGKDRMYAFNQEATDAIREAKAWMKDPTYFKRVKISPSASIKMMSHCQSGVEKGIKNNGNPVEVMGLLLGHPDSEDPHSFIISDAQVVLIMYHHTHTTSCMSIHLSQHLPPSFSVQMPLQSLHL